LASPPERPPNYVLDGNPEFGEVHLAVDSPRRADHAAPIVSDLDVCLSEALADTAAATSGTYTTLAAPWD
jgi:hypothetical protein